MLRALSPVAQSLICPVVAFGAERAASPFGEKEAHSFAWSVPKIPAAGLSGREVVK